MQVSFFVGLAFLLIFFAVGRSEGDLLSWKERICLSIWEPASKTATSLNNLSQLSVTDQPWIFVCFFPCCMHVNASPLLKVNLNWSNLWSMLDCFNVDILERNVEHQHKLMESKGNSEISPGKVACINKKSNRRGEVLLWKSSTLLKSVEAFN